jgi:hypothetical protein
MLHTLKAHEQELGLAEQLSADTGFFSAANVKAWVEAGIEPLIAMGREAHYLPVLERWTEPEPLAEDADAVGHMAHRLKTRCGRANYALRKQTVEPVFGIIKHVMKFRQFLLRGIEKIRHEWNLVATAWKHEAHEGAEDRVTKKTSQHIARRRVKSKSRSHPCF